MCKSLNTSSCDVCTHTEFLCNAQPLLMFHIGTDTDNRHDIHQSWIAEDNAGLRVETKLPLKSFHSSSKAPWDDCLSPGCRWTCSQSPWLLKCSSNDSVTQGLGRSKIVSQNPIATFYKFCPLNVCPQPSKFFYL